MLHKTILDLSPFLDVPETQEYLQLVSENYAGKGERHHILPESLYPEFVDSEWNLVNLSYQDHYKAHELLPFILPVEDRYSMVYAWNQMSGRIAGCVIDADRYAELRQMHSEAVSKQMSTSNPMWLEENKKKFRGRKRPEHSELMTGENNPSKRESVRVKLSENNPMKLEENKRKFRGEKNPNFGKEIPAHQKEILRLRHTGTTQSDETKKRISEGLINSPLKRTTGVVVDGVEYKSVVDAARILGVGRHTIARWVKCGRAYKCEKQAIEVCVDGVSYESISAASKAIGVTPSRLKYMVKHGLATLIDKPKETE